MTELPTRRFVRISEVFGPTIQGEGPAAGQRAVFVRFAGCPVGCDWCDTRYSWDPQARDPDRPTRSRAVADVVDQVLSISKPSDLVVVTGGEPLAQSESLCFLVEALRPARPRLHLETAGMPEVSVELLNQFELVVVSPKLGNAGTRARRHMDIDEYASVAGLSHAWFKFVVSTSRDLDEVAEYQRSLGLTRVMVMVEGVDPQRSLETTAALSAEVIDRGWSISPRLHVWMWGDEPGR